MDIISPLPIQSIRKPWLKRPLFYILLAVAVVLVYFALRLGSIYNAIVVGNDATVTPISEEDRLYPLPSPESDRLDVLVLGIRGYTQKEVEEEGGLLADTIQVVSIDKINRKVAVIAIPRDLSINILGVKGKLNQIYERGLEQKQGLELAKQIISRLTGIYIDKAVVFDFNAFRHIVDTLGGIDVYLARPFSEPSQWGYPFLLPVGNNHLDGEQALYYTRSRLSTSDFDRAHRQQEVMTAIKNKAAKLGYFSNPVKITNLLNALKGDIRTDFQLWDVSDALKLGGTFNPQAAITNYVLSTDNLLYETYNAKSEYILLPKGDNYDMVRELFIEILQGVANEKTSGFDRYGKFGQLVYS